MANFVKLFHVQNAYVDEDGFLSFNPKHEQRVGAVCNSRLDVNDVSSFNDPNSYITGNTEYIVTMMIQVNRNILDYTEGTIPPKEKIKVKKEKIKHQKDFMFLNVKED